MSLARAASHRLRQGAAFNGKQFIQAAHASTSTQYTSQSAYRSPPDRAPIVELPSRIKPIPSSFYTTRPAYVDSLILLEDLARRTKRALEQAHIPLDSMTPQTSSLSSRAANSWLKSEDLSERLGVPLKSSQYRHVIARLKALAKYRRLVQEHFTDGQCGPANRTLALNIEETLAKFVKNSGVASRSESDDFYSKSARVDDLGRAYARGRRKESSARVWVVPKQLEATSEKDSLLSQSILINLQSLPEAFTRVAHREAVLHPLRLTGLMGVVNVFALVQGGGTTGQAGALSHGIARALVTFYDHQAKEAEASNASNAKVKRLNAITMRDILAKGEMIAIRDEDPQLTISSLQTACSFVILVW
jgi:small subunit ribosomal protein S9